MSDKKYKVGDKLWFVDLYGQREVTVEKVGRKWLHFVQCESRADVSTLRVDGGRYSTSGQCYACREDRQREECANDAWELLSHRAYKMRRPDHITTEAIHEAAKLLGIELDV